MSKLKVRKFLGLIPTFVEVTGKKLVKGVILHPILNRVNVPPFFRKVYYAFLTVISTKNITYYKRQLFNSIFTHFFKGDQERVLAFVDFIIVPILIFEDL